MNLRIDKFRIQDLIGIGFTPLEIKSKSYHFPRRGENRKSFQSNIYSDLRSEVSSELSLTGFTLIELLVVISITSLMMAVLLPSLRTARKQAQAVFCLNNLRQMVIVAHIYANSYNGHYPLAYYNAKVGGIRYYYAWDFTTHKDWSTSPPTGIVEAGILWEGGPPEKVHQCPSFKGAHNWFADPYTGYNYNISYIGRDETVSLPGSAKMTEVKSPSETAIFGDGEFSSGANKFMRAPFPNSRDASFFGRWAGTQGYRHLGKANVAFCDGHVESWRALFTETESPGKYYLDQYNEIHNVKIGFLSEDNSAYDLE